MIDSNKIARIIDLRASLRSDDPKISDYWQQLKDILTMDISETIEYLQKCSEHEAYWVSEVFDDIAEVFGSEEIIRVFKGLAKKYPKIDFTKDIEHAIKALNSL